MSVDESNDTGVSKAGARREQAAPRGTDSPPENSAAKPEKPGRASPSDWEVISGRTLGSFTGTITLKPGDVRHVCEDGSAIPILRAELVVANREPILICLYGPTDEYLVGRERSQCHAAVSDSRVSRVHLAVRIQDGAPIVCDRNSTNGTFVNGARVSSTQRLHSGDRIRLGRTEVEFRVL